MKRKPVPAAFPTAGEAFKNASGPISYQMTNDYMFHAALQKNPKVLKGLICSLLNLSPKDIKSIQIMNPIKLGRAVKSKNFILDIDVLLNDNTLINLEMQVANLKNWTNRSLGYLCRSFDQLQRGDDYNSAKPAIHISFLDFTPFKEYPEFYAVYQMINVKNHHVYSDKLELRVVDLTHINLAADEDRACRLDDWARLFKAATWEEIKMIAKKHADLKEASETLFTLNADYLIRKQCDARADYYRLHNSINKELKELASDKKRLTSQNKRLSSKNKRLSSKNKHLSSKNQSLSSKNQSLSSKNQSLSSENQSLSSENQSLLKDNAEKDILIAQLKAQLNEKQP